MTHDARAERAGTRVGPSRGPAYAEFLVRGVTGFVLPQDMLAAVTPAPVAAIQARFLAGSTVVVPFAGTGMDALFLLRGGRSVILSDISPERLALTSANLGAAGPFSARCVLAAATDCFDTLKEFSGSYDAALLDPPWDVSYYHASDRVPLDKMSEVEMHRLVRSALERCPECLVKCPHTICAEDFDRFGAGWSQYRIRFGGRPLMTLVHLGARRPSKTIDMA